MFLSIDQIRESWQRLDRLHPFFGMSFLAFKEADLPIGTTNNVILTQIADVVLERHYRASKEYAGYYNPFFTSDKKKRWVAPRYSSTSLQRITTDTFGDALIHPKGSSIWGWREDYIAQLRHHLGKTLIPAFDLAVWLFREIEWETSSTPKDVIDRLFLTYHISQDEQSLFDITIPKLNSQWLTRLPITADQLLDLIGTPPGITPEEGAALRSLELRETGPSRLLRYEPAERLNLITGDNSLGKTFLLETAWWALTGDWLEFPAQPRTNVAKQIPRLSFEVTKPSGRIVSLSAGYDWDNQKWKELSRKEVTPGLVIYARYDGSFALWDPASSYRMNDSAISASRKLFIRRDQVFDGVEVNASAGRKRYLFNGLISDWPSWQNDKRYSLYYEALIASLKELSLSRDEQLTLGPIMRVPNDSRDIPTIVMPYGIVPVPLVSAGVRRVISLAYVLVWAWREHLVNSVTIRQKPLQRLVLMVDEVESHLHPKWQRVIVPAILKVIDQLSQEVSMQLHIATHSPLVFSSVEPIFKEHRDDQHHLVLRDGEATLEEIPFVRRGTSDMWLTSETFGLKYARSIEAEQAIDAATHLQLQDNPNSQEVEKVNTDLIATLAEDDEFWPLWRFFAKQHGVR